MRVDGVGIGHEHAVSYAELGRSDDETENHCRIAGRDSDAAHVGGSGLDERAEAGECCWDWIVERDRARGGSWAGGIQRGYAAWPHRVREDELGVGHVDAMRWGAGRGLESAVGGKYRGACWERFACAVVRFIAHKRDEAGEQWRDGVGECDGARGEFRACGVHGFLSGGPHGGRANYLGGGHLCPLPVWARILGLSPFCNHDWAFAWHCKCGLLSRFIVAESCPEGQRRCDGRSEHNPCRVRCRASPILSSGA